MLSIICVIISLVLLVTATCIRPKNYPPGPRLMPIIGNIFHYKIKYNKLKYHHLVWMDMAKNYGNIVGTKLGRYLVVTVTGSEAVKEVLSRAEFDGRPDGYFFRLRTFGKRLGIVFTDGKLWKTQRKFCLQGLKNYGFGGKKMEEKVHDECVAFVERCRKVSNQEICMHDIFGIPVINVLWAMIAGKRFDNDDKRLHKLLDMIRECFKIVDISGGIINQIPFLRYIAPSASGYNQIMSMLTNMWTFLGETIDDHKLSMQYTPRDLIDSFLQHTEKKTDESFTDQQLLSMCLDLFMAGAETTSNSLSFAFMYMILYPDVQKKVQQELDQKIGRDRWPTVEDKNNLKYTQAVLMEIQRRCNLAPMGVTHRTTKTTSLYGYTIPENAVILLNLYSIHMNLDYWKDPMEFKPERFLDESGNITVDENYYLPFGLGKRRCLGEGLAKTQIFLFFTCLLHNFTFEAVDGFYPCEEPYDGFALAPKPFKAKLIPRYT